MIVNMVVVLISELATEDNFPSGALTSACRGISPWGSAILIKCDKLVIIQVLNVEICRYTCLGRPNVEP
jgi:hypothetical protein